MSNPYLPPGCDYVSGEENWFCAGTCGERYTFTDKCIEINGEPYCESCAGDFEERATALLPDDEEEDDGG